MTHSLIEKLEAEAFNPTGDDRMGKLIPLDKAIAILRVHEIEEPEEVERIAMLIKDAKTIEVDGQKFVDVAAIK